MPVLPFSELPDSARVWIHAAEQPLGPDQAEALARHMEQFLAEWRSHGREVVPSWQLAYDRFVMIGVDEAAMSLSGCSIDSMFRSLDHFARAAGLRLSTSGGQVFYRDAAGEIQCVERFAFGDLARRDAVGEHTVVFDNTVSTVGELRAGRWEVPMRQSWHGQVFLPQRV